VVVIGGISGGAAHKREATIQSAGSWSLVAHGQIDYFHVANEVIYLLAIYPARLRLFSFFSPLFL
jgi:hypothetical protein